MKRNVCKAKGVSRFCYGFCRLDDGDSSARSGMARRACIEYEEVIETCMNAPIQNSSDITAKETSLPSTTAHGLDGDDGDGPNPHTFYDDVTTLADEEEPSSFICKDTGNCTNVTPKLCQIFPQLNESCPATCQTCTCKDETDCSHVTDVLCEAHSYIRDECYKTCGVCEDKGNQKMADKPLQSRECCECDFGGCYEFCC